MSKLKILSNSNKLFNKFGFHLSKIKPISPDKDKIMLNLGSGDWSHKNWINLDYPSDWYAKAQNKHTIIPYDIRNDNIPYEDNFVDAIYCSHVIEHIEDKHIINMFKESFRVLKPNAILRIACPDAEFLYNITKLDTDTDYWKWRDEWFNNSSFYKQTKTPRKIDYLVREIATPQLLDYVNSINEKDYLNEFNNLEMYDFFEYLTKDLCFRKEFTGDHINYWTFSKLDKYLKKIGFRHVILSKQGASCSKEMQSLTKFDLTCPMMSLYVDVIK